MHAIRKLALLGMAALAVCAFVASTASAAGIHSDTVGNPLYTGPVTGTALNTTTLAPSGTGGFGTVSCTSSMLGGSITGNNPVAGSITSASWSGCTSNLGGTCNTTGQAAGVIVGTGLPWSVTAAYAPVVGGRDGTMTVSNAGATIVCPLGTCNYMGTVTGDLYNHNNANMPIVQAGTTNAQVKFTSVPLTLDTTKVNSSSCASTSSWSGVYELVGLPTTGGTDMLTIANA